MVLPYTISRNMLRTSSMNMKFSTKILVDDNLRREVKFYLRTFTYGERCYYMIDSKSHISIAWLGDNGTKADGAYIMVDERNIYYLLTTLKDMRNLLMRDDIYYKENGDLKMYTLNEDVHVKKLMMNNNTFVKLYPSIYEDYQGYKFEVIHMSINSDTFTIPLNIEQLDAMIYILSKVDFFVYSELLLNHFLNSLGKTQIINEGIPKYQPRIAGQIYNEPLKDVEMEYTGPRPRNKNIFADAGLDV